jgi:hypothetical protein
VTNDDIVRIRLVPITSGGKIVKFASDGVDYRVHLAGE